MRSGKIRIKRYKSSRRRGVFLLLLSVPVLLAAGFFLFRQGVISLPSFSGIALSQADMQQQTRVLTLPGATHFALQLGVFSEKGGADALAQDYQGRGAGCYIWHQDGYRVLAAAYETREDARAVQQRLMDAHGVDAYLYTLTRSEVTLRLTGQKAQLDALSDAYDLCVQLTATLSRLSEELDSGSMNETEVRSALLSQQETVAVLNSRLLSLFSKEEHPAVSALTKLMESALSDISAALDTANATRLGSRVKYCQLHLLCSLEQYVSSLSP